MGDSDEEFDSRRREKFRRERNDYQTEPPPVRVQRPPRREEWGGERGDWNRPGGGGPPPRRDYREYPPKNFDRSRAYSPGGRPLDGSPVSPPPPPKRPRAEWPERPGYGGFDGGFAGFGGGRPPYPGPDPGPYSPYDNYASEPPPVTFPRHREPSPRKDWNAPPMPPPAQPPPAPADVDYPTQPPLMTFKGFLATQSDDISDEDAIKKYGEYKLGFRRQQINEFFLAHMEEEWFKQKYHPEDSTKRKEEQTKAIQDRLKVFNELLEKRFFTNLTVDADMAEGLVRLLDTVVIKLEGGNDNDLKILDQGPPPDIMVGPKRELDKKEAEQEELQRKARALLENKAPVQEDGPPEKKKDGDESESDNEDEDLVPPGMENREKEDEKMEEDEEAEEKKEEPAEVKKTDGAEDIESGDELDKAAEEVPKEEPRALHKTASIFLRSIHPAVTKAEIEKLCTRYPGFLRCAIADPAPERRWFRRGWVTFERTTNIKEICWNLNNMRMKDAELGAILNRDLARRIRTVSGITCHKTVVRNDIRIAAKVVVNLDQKAGLWAEPENGEAVEKAVVPFGDLSKNPVMKNITEYLIEEGSAEEEELIGASGDADAAAAQGCDLERDEELIAVLDRLIMYLRIVHSVDFYNHSEYPNEDEMPNRCGILHTRGIPPSTKLTQKELADYMKSFESKMTPYMEIAPLLTLEEAKNLGMRDPDEEVEKFILANTQELAKDKYLCPLSGKKFRGPDFVRKHILNKHAERLEDVRQEVIFYNNYIRDPKRPHLPEHPGSTPGPSAGPVANSAAANLLTSNPAVAALANAAANNPAVMAAVAAVASNALKSGGQGVPPDLMQRLGLAGAGGRDQNGGPRGRDRGTPRGGRGGFRGGRGRNDPRSVVGYHDLDAPEDVEMF